MTLFQLPSLLPSSILTLGGTRSSANGCIWRREAGMHKSLLPASEFIAGNEAISFAVIYRCTTRPMRYKQRRQPCRTINCHKPNCHHEMQKSHVKTAPLTGRRGPFGSCSSSGMKHRCLFQSRQGGDAWAWPPRHQDEGLGHLLALTHGGQSSNPKS